MKRHFLTLLTLLAFALPGHSSLLTWYRFNEGSGATATDSSGNGANLSAVDGGVLWNQKANPPFGGGSIHFNGTGSVRAQKLTTTQLGNLKHPRREASCKEHWGHRPHQNLNPTSQGPAAGG